MFDIGFQELVIIFVIALLVFGPEKLPEVGRTLGKWLIEIRRGIHNAKVQMEGEFEEAERKRAEEEAKSVSGEKEKIDRDTAETKETDEGEGKD
jgi:sec-independent protein translocase protein TatB